MRTELRSISFSETKQEVEPGIEGVAMVIDDDPSVSQLKLDHRAFYCVSPRRE